MSTIAGTVRRACLGLPGTQEVVSHGYPTYRAAGRHFATFSVNHHGDGRVALLLNIGRDTQQMLTASAPGIFFVPPYSGPQGWVGVELNRGLDWARVARLAFDAWSRVAPAADVRNAAPVALEAPTEAMTPADIDPLLAPQNQAILTRLRGLCLALPETSEGRQFGDPAFKAGKKTFCTLSCRRRRLSLQVWVGNDRQSALVEVDDRYVVPAYIGHNGWIDLELDHRQDWDEIEALVTDSYAHFALKRMLKAIGRA